MSTLALSHGLSTLKQIETAIHIYQSAVAKGFQADQSESRGDHRTQDQLTKLVCSDTSRYWYGDACMVKSSA